MRRFVSVHKTTFHGLGAVLQNTENLEPVVHEFLSELRSSCAAVPEYEFSIQWANMSSDTLAYTYTYYVPTANYWTPANVFEVYFNPRVPWSNGTCSEAASQHYDLKTAVMHEVLHGLGFLSTVASDKTSFPTNYDILLRDAHGSRIVNENGVFEGNFGQSVYINNVRMFNPGTFNEGSSLSHVHASSRLMSYAQTECQQYLDYNSKVILNELGYQCGQEVQTRVGKSDSSPMVIGIVLGVVVLILVVVVATTCGKGRKKRDLQTPLLTKT